MLYEHIFKKEKTLAFTAQIFSIPTEPLYYIQNKETEIVNIFICSLFKLSDLYPLKETSVWVSKLD